MASVYQSHEVWWTRKLHDQQLTNRNYNTGSLNIIWLIQSALAPLENSKFLWAYIFQPEPDLSESKQIMSKKRKITDFFHLPDAAMKKTDTAQLGM